DFPVPLWAFRMRVVARHTGCAHDHRTNETYAIAEGRCRHFGQLLIDMTAQRSESTGLKIIKCVRGAVFERKVRDEAVTDVLLLLADDATELERECRRDRNGAWNAFVIMHHLGRAPRGQHAADHVAAVVTAHAADH